MAKQDVNDGHPLDRDAEWLEADGFGGFASGTVGGPRTRRYHALLLTATKPPTVRVLLVNGVDVFVEGPAGRVALSSQRYAPDVVAPDGMSRLAGFSRDPWPQWRWNLPDGIGIEHELFVDPRSCATVLRWRRRAGTGACRLTLRPFLSGRDFGALHYANPAFRFDAATAGGNVAWRPYPEQPAVTALTNGSYEHDPEWYRDFLYTEERDRGYNDTEDLGSPGVFSFDLATGHDAVMVLRTGDDLAGDAVSLAATLSASERARRSAAPTPLARSALSYRVARGKGSTIMAGFPWFSDWGRDTFISMRGLVLATGDLAAAEAILLAWADMVSEGMLPNRFPDRGVEPEYNAADASLWYVVVVHEFLDARAAAGRPAGETLGGRLRRACESILEGYSVGTRFGIATDSDGLVRAGTSGVQVTWMDAKTGDYVVTPRIGKPVEIQALWINALHIAGTRWNDRWRAVETKARASFAARFIRPDGAGLCDVVDVDHAPGTVDAKVRPNQIFAVGGLPFPILSGDAARSVVEVVERHLLTPLGLRTLAPDDPAYQGHYRGGLVERRRRLSSGDCLALAHGTFRRGLARGPRRDRGGKGRGAPALPAAAAGPCRAGRPRPRLGGRRRRPASHPRRLPVPGLVARRVDPDPPHARCRGVTADREAEPSRPAQRCRPTLRAATPWAPRSRPRRTASRPGANGPPIISPRPTRSRAPETSSNCARTSRSAPGDERFKAFAGAQHGSGPPSAVGTNSGCDFATARQRSAQRCPSWRPAKVVLRRRAVTACRAIDGTFPQLPRYGSIPTAFRVPRPIVSRRIRP